MHWRTLLTATLAMAAIVALRPGQASAVEARAFWVDNTQELLDLCTVPPDDPQRGEAIHYCIAYLDGVVDYHDALSEHKDMKRLICYPNTATLEQGVLVFIDWAEEKRADAKLMGEAPVIGVVRALAGKWPCKQ